MKEEIQYKMLKKPTKYSNNSTLSVTVVLDQFSV
jgi:hypothetical protein